MPVMPYAAKNTTSRRVIRRAAGRVSPTSTNRQTAAPTERSSTSCSDVTPAVSTNLLIVPLTANRPAPVSPRSSPRRGWLGVAVEAVGTTSVVVVVIRQVFLADQPA